MQADELYQLIDKLNKDYFNDKIDLSQISEIQFDDKVHNEDAIAETIVEKPDTYQLKLSPNFVKYCYDSLEDTLIHELIHIYLWQQNEGHAEKHGQNFTKISKSISKKKYRTKKDPVLKQEYSFYIKKLINSN